MVLKDKVVVYMEPGALPAAALGELIDKVRALDIADARRNLAEAHTDT